MEMRAEEQAQMAEAKITLFELVTSPTLKLPLLIAIIMQLSQQLSGINAVRIKIQIKNLVLALAFARLFFKKSSNFEKYHVIFTFHSEIFCIGMVS